MSVDYAYLAQTIDSLTSGETDQVALHGDHRLRGAPVRSTL